MAYVYKPLQEHFKEINEAGGCVLEVIDRGEWEHIADYLINLKDKKIEKKRVCKKGYDLLKEVSSSYIEKVIKSFEGFDIHDFEKNYIYGTEFKLIRLQKEEE